MFDIVIDHLNHQLFKTEYIFIMILYADLVLLLKDTINETMNGTMNVLDKNINSSKQSKFQHIILTIFLTKTCFMKIIVMFLNIF
jgi:hypothetical protein